MHSVKVAARTVIKLAAARWKNVMDVSTWFSDNVLIFSLIMDKIIHFSVAALTSEHLTKASFCSPSIIRPGSGQLSNHQLQWRFPGRDSWVVPEPESKWQLWKRSCSRSRPGSDVSLRDSFWKKKKQLRKFSIAESTRALCKEWSSSIAAKN